MRAYSAALPHAAPATGRTAIERTFYLLGRAMGFTDFVGRYTEGDMAEIFTPTQREALEAGATINLSGTRWTDMVAAARAAGA